MIPTNTFGELRAELIHELWKACVDKSKAEPKDPREALEQLYNFIDSRGTVTFWFLSKNVLLIVRTSFAVYCSSNWKLAQKYSGKYGYGVRADQDMIRNFQQFAKY